VVVLDPPVELPLPNEPLDPLELGPDVEELPELPGMFMLLLGVTVPLPLMLPVAPAVPEELPAPVAPQPARAAHISRRGKASRTALGLRNAITLLLAKDGGGKGLSPALVFLPWRYAP
jgi:hypothetical protein